MNAGVAERGKVFHHFEVPSGNKPTARIRRASPDLKALLTAVIDQGAYKKSLVLAVSITEDYLIDLMKLVLRAHPDRLGRGVKRGDSKPTIALEDFIERSRDEILEELIRSRVGGALYAKPAEYLAYVASILEVEVPAESAAGFIEVKATRDIVVHGDGRANERYIEKAGQRARVAAGEPLLIDGVYFDSAIGTMKSLIYQLAEKVAAKYADDDAVTQCAKAILR
ncbi:hypothetical protein CFHF_21395 [Caulobacter flavus]|uniref:Uncharacterized protein n=2 Tax=Caulobacter flavus TaxID=1679497 RepID=A0A2N5CMW9_9CAUL|nr:hypothetical protein C1707_09920 [Caulobacter flavus]PLR07790.1 hypothetical protein CFHF_21395 [Caulobacter flavus]